MEHAAASPPAPGHRFPIRSKRRDLLEIGIAYALIEAVEWTPRPWQRGLWLVAALGIAIMLWRSFDGWAVMGFRARNFWRSAWIIAAAGALSAAAMLVSARAHTLLAVDGLWVFPEIYGAYAVWSAVQQILLQGFFLLRMLRVMPKPWQAALVATILFSAAHIPNPILVSLTFIWGFFACALFLRYRIIYPLMFAHAILGITIAMTIPGPVVHNMRVGLSYLTYRPHMHAHHTHLLSQP